MWWELELKDGTKKKEVFVNDYNDINKSDIKWLTLRDRATKYSAPIDLEENYLKIPYLNEEQLKFIEEVPRMVLEFDKPNRCYHFDPDTLKFLKSVFLKDDSFYFSFGLGRGFVILEDKQYPYNMFITMNDTQLSLFDQGTEKEGVLDYIIDAHSDFKHKGNESQTSGRIDTVNVFYNGTWELENVEYLLKLAMCYIPTTRTIQFKAHIKASQEDIPIELFMKNPIQDFSVRGKTGQAFLGLDLHYWTV